MPRTITFHLDEHIHPGIADDATHLAYARAAGRVLVTHDADFPRLHRQGVPHAGMVYCHQRQALGDLLHHLVLLWEVLDPQEMHNQVEYP